SCSACRAPRRRRASPTSSCRWATSPHASSSSSGSTGWGTERPGEDTRGKEVLMQRILVVEDSPTQAEELRYVLESEGFEVEVMPDAEKAIARVPAGGLDLVISDIVMPGDSGYDLCRAIKRNRRD